LESTYRDEDAEEAREVWPVVAWALTASAKAGSRRTGASFMARERGDLGEKESGYRVRVLANSGRQFVARVMARPDHHRLFA